MWAQLSRAAEEAREWEGHDRGLPQQRVLHHQGLALPAVHVREGVLSFLVFFAVRFKAGVSHLITVRLRDFLYSICYYTHTGQ